MGEFQRIAVGIEGPHVVMLVRTGQRTSPMRLKPEEARYVAGLLQQGADELATLGELAAEPITPELVVHSWSGSRVSLYFRQGWRAALRSVAVAGSVALGWVRYALAPSSWKRGAELRAAAAAVPPNAPGRPLASVPAKPQAPRPAPNDSGPAR